MIKIASWAAENNGDKFFKIFNDIQADIVCVQDLELSESQFMGFNPVGYQSYWNWKEKNKEAGTAVFTKIKPLSSEWGIGSRLDRDGRSLILEYPEFYLLNVLAPQKKKKYDLVRMEWDTAFLDYATNLLETKPVVICGNMNVAYSDYSEMTSADPEQSEISSLLQLGMMDTYRCRYPGNGDSMLRLDFCLISDSLRSKLVSSTIYNVGTEIIHKPIDMVLSINDPNIVQATATVPLPLLYWASRMPKPLDLVREVEE